MSAVSHTADRLLDRIADWSESKAEGRWAAFVVCGFAGSVLALALGLVLAKASSQSLLVLGGIALAAVSTLLGLVLATKVLTGEERIVNLHHQTAVLLVTSLLLGAWDQPVLAHLEITALGVGLVVAVGRVGCLLAGCCHGRPSSWGVRYRDGHAAAGFTHYLVGVRLWPVQALESLWTLAAVLAGSAFVLAGAETGAALAGYLLAYATGRFFFEFLRGDPDRSYLLGFSQNQWICLVWALATVGLGRAGFLPHRRWHVAVAAGLSTAVVAVALARRLRETPGHQLLHPHHVREVAELVVKELPEPAESPTAGPPPLDLHMICTSLGIQISAGRVREAGRWVDHYALSHRTGILTEGAARVLSGLILRLKRTAGPSELVSGGPGVFHLLVRS